MPDFETHPIGTGARLAELEASYKRAFLAGHADGWAGNQQRREVQHVDAENGWKRYTEAAALTSTQPSGATEAIDGVREELRQMMLKQPRTEERNTYNDGFGQGLSYAIGKIDEALMRAAPTSDKCCDPDNQMGMPESCPRCPQRADSSMQSGGMGAGHRTRRSQGDQGPRINGRNGGMSKRTHWAGLGHSSTACGMSIPRDQRGNPVGIKINPNRAEADCLRCTQGAFAKAKG